MDRWIAALLILTICIIIGWIWYNFWQWLLALCLLGYVVYLTVPTIKAYYTFFRDVLLPEE